MLDVVSYVFVAELVCCLHTLAVCDFLHSIDYIQVGSCKFLRPCCFVFLIRHAFGPHPEGCSNLFAQSHKQFLGPSCEHDHVFHAFAARGVGRHNLGHHLHNGLLAGEFAFYGVAGYRVVDAHLGHLNCPSAPLLRSFDLHVVYHQRHLSLSLIITSIRPDLLVRPAPTSPPAGTKEIAGARAFLPSNPVAPSPIVADLPHWVAQQRESVTLDTPCKDSLGPQLTQKLESTSRFDTVELTLGLDLDWPRAYQSVCTVHLLFAVLELIDALTDLNGIEGLGLPARIRCHRRERISIARACKLSVAHDFLLDPGSSGIQRLLRSCLVVGSL